MKILYITTREDVPMSVHSSASDANNEAMLRDRLEFESSGMELFEYRSSTVWTFIEVVDKTESNL